MANDKVTAAMQLLSIMVTLSISGSAFDLRRGYPDISLFYSTDAIIWTLNTTMNTNLFCKVDFVNTTTEDHTEFRRVTGLNTSRDYEDLNGTFISLGRITKSPPYNAMVVRPRQEGNEKSTEELLREYGNYTCGIFSVMLSTTIGTFYELRMKNSSIHDQNRICFEDFRKTAYVESTKIYNESCQTFR
uniref:Lipocalin n=1 Tax=Rhipicephalus zambeziensis TaxID=60191 RepID=A0A224YN87_9ACAR